MARAAMISILAFSVIISSLSVTMVILENFSGILKFLSQLEGVEDEGDDCSILKGCMMTKHNYSGYSIVSLLDSPIV